MHVSKLPHMPAIYQLPRTILQIHPNAKWQNIHEIGGKTEYFCTPFDDKKRKFLILAHLLCVGFGFFVIVFFAWPLRKRQASLWRQILLNLDENSDLYLWVENSAIHYGHTM